MIARIGIFEPQPPDVREEARRNLRERFMPALQAQEGFIAGYWAIGEDERVWSITFWESEEALRTGGQHAHATPLLPDQDASKIPSPDSAQIFTVDVYAQGKTTLPLTADRRWFNDV